MAESLRFSIGGFMGNSHLLELTDSGLWHTTFEDGAPSAAHPHFDGVKSLLNKTFTGPDAN